MLLRSMVAGIGLLFAGLTQTLFAAEIKVVSQSDCGISLSGEIISGDAKKLKAALQKSSRGSICLNSPGGSYPEALKMIDVVFGSDTLIRSDAKCYSACALVFLAGSYVPEAAEGETVYRPRRTLQPGGKLGFHAPYADGMDDVAASPQTIAVAVKVGVDSILDLLDRNEFGLFPDKLLGKAMRLGPKELYEISAVEDAARAEIIVPQKVRLAAVDEAAATRACRTALDADGTKIDALHKGKKEKNGGVERYLFELEMGANTGLCEVMYTGSLEKLFVQVELNTEFIHEKLTADVAVEFRGQLVNSERWSQWYYLLPGRTSLASLRAGSVTKPSDQKTAKTALQIFRNYDFSGNDIGTVNTSTADACAARCTADGSCKAFSYNRWAKKCFLKSSFDGARFEPRSVSGNMVGSYKSGAKPDTVQKFRDRKFKDKAVRTTDAESFDDCLASCLRDSACIAINFHKPKGQCHFFTGVNEYYPDAEYDAAMRWEEP
jgi:hypothetical protein